MTWLWIALGSLSALGVFAILQSQIPIRSTFEVEAGPFEVGEEIELTWTFTNPGLLPARYGTDGCGLASFSVTDLSNDTTAYGMSCAEIYVMSTIGPRTTDTDLRTWTPPYPGCFEITTRSHEKLEIPSYTEIVAVGQNCD